MEKWHESIWFCIVTDDSDFGYDDLDIWECSS